MESTLTDASRRDLYRDPRIRRLLAAMTKPNGDLFPNRALEGDYRYYEAEEILQTSPEETLELLNQLSEAEILEKVLLMQPACPTCKSTELVTKPGCPFCGRSELKKVVAIEHLRCGYLGSEELFSAEGQLVCPMCGESLGNSDQRRNGNAFECISCLKVTTNPVLLQECKSCAKIHDHESVELKPVYTF